MPAKYSLKEYKLLAESLGGSYILDDVPNNTSAVVEGWKCTGCEKIFGRSYCNVSSKKSCFCNACSRGLKFLKDYQELAKQHQGEYLLDTIPDRVKVTVKNAWRCKEGHIFDKSYQNVKKGIWCLICAGLKVGIDEYKKVAEQHGGQYTLDYIPDTTMDKVEGWKCQRNHTFKTSYNLVRTNWWCVECTKIDRLESKDKCKHTFRCGKRKGEQCTHKAVVDGYCQSHKSYLDSRKKYYEEKERKEEEAKEQEEEDLKKEILDLVLPFDQKDVRVLGTYKNPLFVAKDIAEILGYKDTKRAVQKHVDEDDKIRLNDKRVDLSPLPEYNLDPQTILINESGLYSLILRSKLPKAKEFKRWVTSEVLHSIREKGSYIASPNMQAQFDLLNDKLKATETLLLEAKEEKDALVQQKEEELYKANRKYERLKERKTQVKFNPKNCIYLTLNLKEKPADPKFGKSDDINARMATYRTNAPYTKILYLVFVEENDLVEKSLKCILKNNIIPSNHEFLIKMDYMDIVQKIEEIMNFLNLKYKVEEERVEIYNKAVTHDFEDEVEKRV